MFFTTSFFFILALGLSSLVAAVEFIKPPSFGVKGDLSSNPTYKQYDTIDLVWSDQPQGVPYSEVLYQMKGSETRRGRPDRVAMDRCDAKGPQNISNVFVLIMLKEGTSTHLASSHYFNISQSITSSSTEPARVTETMIVNGNKKDQMSTASAIGIGIGAAAAVALCIAAGVFVWLRKKGQTMPPPTGLPAAERSLHYQHKAMLYDPDTRYKLPAVDQERHDMANDGQFVELPVNGYQRP
ncbi:hypothetical protein QBC44DRAFT_367520 [Cladorrhinum sp. PSN332]|nr:hypothetical protein QBC44DRAFT_367520 [Cladorrhinum sp. PSN332]